MITESCSYLKKTKNASFTIHLVVFDGNQYEVFKTKLEKFPIESASTSGKSKKRRSFLKSNPKFSVATANVPAHLGSTDFFIQGIHVLIVKGDITKDSSDAIVNSTSPEIDLMKSGEIAKIIFKLAGPQLQTKCSDAVKSNGNLTVGKVIETKVKPPFKCKSILHICFQNNDDVQYVKTIKSCLEKAEELHYKTLALPVIGTGVQKYPIPNASKGIAEGINQFGLTNPKYLKEVRIVIFNDDVYDTFLQTIQQEDIDSSQPFPMLESADKACALSQDYISSLEFESSDDEQADTSSSAFCYWPSQEISSIEENDDEVPQTGLKLEICGFDKTGVSGAVGRLNSLIKENYEKDEINEDSISDLSHLERQEIKKECKAFGVECKIEPDIGRIRLTGNVNDITKIRTKVNSIIYKVMSRRTDERDKQLQHRYDVDTLYHTVKWQYKKNGSMKYISYDKEVSYEIEQAFQEFKASSHKNIFHYKNGPYKITIDFNKHQEKDHATKQQSHVRRYATTEHGM